MKHVHPLPLKRSMESTFLLIAVGMLCGCAYDTTAMDGRLGGSRRQVIVLKEILPQYGQVFLTRLKLGDASVSPKGNALIVRGTPSDVYRAAVLMDLVDTREEFCIETLAYAWDAGALPSNARTAEALGGISIGTFANPPQGGERTRAIIDVHGTCVVAIIPTRIRKELLAFLASSGGSSPQAGSPASYKSVSTLADNNEPPPTATEPTASVASAEPSQAESPTGTSQRQEAVTATAPAEPNASTSATRPADVNPEERSPSQAAAKRLYDFPPLPNGEDVLQLDLPDQVEMSQLLDLAAEYLHIDYMYDPEKLRGQMISWKLHGKLQGEIRVKDLYPLLESVLRFKGFAMTRHKDNLVTIVPMADALEADPTLVDPNGDGLDTGDMVVTRVFNLQSVSPASAMALLDNMKISAASSIVEETRSLIVTCYAHRMERIERLIGMVDRPGRLKEFRFRELKHTSAETLCKKVETLVVELQASPLEAGARSLRSSSPGLQVRTSLSAPSAGPLRAADSDLPSNSTEPRCVYLEADPRTNRILMVGHPEQLAVVEEIIDALDVIQQDLRTFKSYQIKNVDAEEVRKHLARFDLVDEEEAPPRAPAPGTDPGTGAVVSLPTGGKDDPADRQKAQVSVLAASNSLLIHATQIQHVRIAHVIEYVDTVARQEAIPYEIYFLENQDPEHMAEVLRQLLRQSVEDKEAKIETTVRKAEEEIVIVPDQNTFSLIVYASRKNQEWVRKLIRTLDKRRPQVLIDATLVEIRKNDEFSYDLEMVAGLPALTTTSGQVPPFMADENASVTDRLGSSGRSQFAEFQVKSGKGVGFYADEHIQALLTAVQTKNYGRVLAKPKVLVNDNEKGNIKTADTTYVVRKSSVPVTAGAAGTQNQLIETAVTYEPYEAGITLEITPHISDGDLLRLDVQLTRSDFTSVSEEKPPNQTSSNVGTVVTVPDGSTIILGGMLKLNQNKGGSKIPILGDLPLIGVAFRSISTKDIQSMLYIFVRAEVIRPADTTANSQEDLNRISDANREAFERHEQEFQNYQTWPGVKAKPVSPPKVLDAR